jgi:hypothetical protein
MMKKKKKKNRSTFDSSKMIQKKPDYRHINNSDEMSSDEEAVWGADGVLEMKNIRTLQDRQALPWWKRIFGSQDTDEIDIDMPPPTDHYNVVWMIYLLLGMSSF